VLGLLRFLLPFVPVAAIPPLCLAPLLRGRAASAELDQTLMQVLRRLPADTIRARLRAAAGVDARAALARVRVPILYLQASRDRVVPRAAGDLIARLRPHTQMVVLDAPHFLLQTQAAAAAAAISAFIREAGTQRIAIDPAL
jgi:pimeloyl-ACP methyl ester carboxylesterase